MGVNGDRHRRVRCSLLLQVTVGCLVLALDVHASPAAGKGQHRQRVWSRKLSQCSSPENCVPQIIEGGTLVRGCSVQQNSTTVFGSTILSTIYEVKPSIRECCSACLEARDCNAWDFCTSNSGCLIPASLNISAEFRASNPRETISIPGNACILIAKRASDPGTRPLIPDNDFTSGEIQRLFLPSISGYATYIGKTVPDQYDFACGYSPLKSRCEIYGTIPEISSICTADLRCRGFVYVNSYNSSEKANLGILKGGATDMGLLTEADLTNDAFTTTYALTMKGLESQQPVPESSSNSNLWIILVSTIGAVLIVSLAVVIITFIVMTKKYQKAAQDHMEFASAQSSELQYGGSFQQQSPTAPRSEA
jgi:hypothetical protein